MVRLPLLWLHVSNLGYLFVTKTVVMPITGLSLFKWALVADKSGLRISLFNSNVLLAKAFGATFLKSTQIIDITHTIGGSFKSTTTIGPKANSL